VSWPGATKAPLGKTSADRWAELPRRQAPNSKQTHCPRVFCLAKSTPSPGAARCRGLHVVPIAWRPHLCHQALYQ